MMRIASYSNANSAIDLNVTDQVKILELSPLFKKRVADGSLKIVGARYNLESGKVGAGVK